MTREENERWYDEHVAPALAELAKGCVDRGMSLLASVGNQGDRYSTRFLATLDDPAMRVVYYAMKAQGNVDALISVLIKDAEERGGTDFSLYLTAIKRYEAMMR